jgi:hypothetical protein
MHSCRPAALPAEVRARLRGELAAATEIAPGSNAYAMTHAAGRAIPPEGEPIWTSACSTSSAASMPTNISQSREGRRPLAPTLAVSPAQPSLATAAEPRPIPAPVRHTELFHDARRSCSFRAFRRGSQSCVTRTVPPGPTFLGVRPGCNDTPRKSRINSSPAGDR